jgi:hypothetical protein
LAIFLFPIAGVEQWLVTELKRKNGVNTFCRFRVIPQTTSTFGGDINNDDFSCRFASYLFYASPHDRRDEVF